MIEIKNKRERKKNGKYILKNIKEKMKKKDETYDERGKKVNKKKMPERK